MDLRRIEDQWVDVSCQKHLVCLVEKKVEMCTFSDGPVSPLAGRFPIGGRSAASHGSVLSYRYLRQSRLKTDKHIHCQWNPELTTEYLCMYVCTEYGDLQALEYSSWILKATAPLQWKCQIFPMASHILRVRTR